MIHKLKFHFYKLTAFIYVLYREWISKQWHLVEGIYLPINRKIGFNTYRWILNGQYEQGELRIIKKTLEKDDIVMEIGSGLGFISSYCCKIIGDKKVFTYEANVHNYHLAKVVFNKNAVNPVIKNELLSDENGTYKFYIDKKNRLSSSVLRQDDLHNGSQIIKTKLNEVIYELRPSYLIMDIEGGEYDIFRIIEFQSINKIQFELHPTLLSASQVDFIFSTLEKNNFVKDKELSVHPNYYYKK
jgi:FkbM family methyltransferase